MYDGEHRHAATAEHAATDHADEGVAGHTAAHDVDAAGTPPVSLRGGTALVAAGGSIGTAGRYVLDVSISGGLLPLGTAIANVTGAFLLGLLIALLSDHVGDPSRRQWLRLLVGTGVLGGYTTYSALSVDIATLSADGETLVAAGYGLGALLVGGLACWLGLRVGRRRGRR